MTDTTDDEAPLPPIESWWPHLTIGARHALLAAPLLPLDERVREEIARITGFHAGAAARLSDADLAFLQTQQEAVD